MILDQLLEKKDVLAYIGLRIEQLNKNREAFRALLPRPDISNADKAKAMEALNKFKGRIEELIRLQDIVRNNRMKFESKKTWRNLNKSWFMANYKGGDDDEVST